MTTLSKTFIALAFIGMSSLSLASQCGTEHVDELELVGETRLSVMFWDVYDAQLYSDSGNYEDAEKTALKLTYLRDIEAEDLVETTQEEWERLDYEINDQAKSWLSKLNEIWPDVTDGDCITLVTEADGTSIFYGNDGELGRVDDKEFSERFLAIWLSKESRFKDERNELIGAGS